MTPLYCVQHDTAGKTALRRAYCTTNTSRRQRAEPVLLDDAVLGVEVVGLGLERRLLENAHQLRLRQSAQDKTTGKGGGRF